MTENLITVIHSLPSPDALIATILPKYSIPRAKNCRLLKKGLNDTYLIETELDPYILRVYRCNWRTKEEIDFELELLSFLQAYQLPVAYPIPTQEGNLTTAIFAPEGKRYVALFFYAPGDAVNQKLDVQQSQRLGEITAQIHQATHDFRSKFNRRPLHSEYLLDWAWSWIAPLFEYKKKDTSSIEAQIDSIKADLADLNLPYISPAYGICVGDVHSENAHFTAENKPTLFDFDQCGYGWRAFDIAKFLHSSYTRKIDKNVSQIFINGYQNVRKLSELELASIPIFTRVAHIWVLGINASVAGEVVPYGHYTDEWLENKLIVLAELASY